MVSELQHFPVHQLQSKGEEARKGPSPCSSTLHPGASTAEPGRAPGKAVITSRFSSPCYLLLGSQGYSKEKCMRIQWHLL
ncbi:hypothetical protein Y1Q_0012830 [Alligator mississippiensis]|uniref:Uncharacterized protein n=1 Tax=Alligator mississippiensis TaxID=8496 RepID=A0A151P474_ALLMI|nr:hypothetical protein Y1Q_0012830 [Alligator mississippiensis]